MDAANTPIDPSCPLNSLLYELDSRRRLDSFKSLKTGWLDGEGDAFSSEGLDWLADSFEAFYRCGMPLPIPYIFPTPERNVLLVEWPFTLWPTSLEVDLAAKTGDFHALNPESDEEEIDELDLTDPEDWK